MKMEMQDKISGRHKIQKTQRLPFKLIVWSTCLITERRRKLQKCHAIALSF